MAPMLRFMHSGLDQVLATGNMTSYPSLCADVTASFSVVSDTIKMAQSRLQQLQASYDRTNAKEHQIVEAVDLIAQLQSKEQIKLNLTAALHLERIRHHNTTSQLEQEQRQHQDTTNIATPAVNNAAIASLMKQDVATLQKQIAVCVEEINEVLEELRCSTVDQAEE
jgi:vacuolar-type H+-ATPase subunit I/STV1